VAFYKGIRDGRITPDRVREFLTEEGAKLLNTGGGHYYTIRDRFNAGGDPLDFLFLSRSCFNGMMRFNRSGGFNVPFCRKPGRYSQALVTRICNQIRAVSGVIGTGDCEFRHQDFNDTLSETGRSDLIYCDPPYIGRHVDYFDSWSEADERELRDMLKPSRAKFIVTTWLRNRWRTNECVSSLWGDCSILTKKHFYHVGARERNRNAVYEALLVDFPVRGPWTFPFWISSEIDYPPGNQFVTGREPGTNHRRRAFTRSCGLVVLSGGGDRCAVSRSGIQTALGCVIGISAMRP